MARLTTLSLIMGLPMRNYGAFTPKAEAVVVFELLSQKVAVVTAIRNTVSVVGAIRDKAGVISKITDGVETT